MWPCDLPETRGRSIIDLHSVRFLKKMLERRLQPAAGG
jgi:hypothetical protein